MTRRTPPGPPPPLAVQRVRIRYAKRGRLRFSSHRDFARAFERALRRAEVPMAYSAGFSPHPKISYVGAAPTGVASEAEYLEIAVIRAVEPSELVAALNAVLPDGLDIVEAVPAASPGFAERMQASHWLIEMPGADRDEVRRAVEAFLAAGPVMVTRLTKEGRRELDARTPVVSAEVSDEAHGAGVSTPSDGPGPDRAILEMVVRQVTPTVRPDDVLSALSAVAGLALPLPPLAVRLAQGPLDDRGSVGDPLAADRAAQRAPL